MGNILSSDTSSSHTLPLPIPFAALENEQADVKKQLWHDMEEHGW
jgi:hypothetical protein